jgi:hypothetical protein
MYKIKNTKSIMSTVEEMMKNAKSKETAIQNGSSTYKYTYTRADGTKITSRRGTPAVPKKAPGPSSSSSSGNKGVSKIPPHHKAIGGRSRRRKNNRRSSSRRRHGTKSFKSLFHF